MVKREVSGCRHVTIPAPPVVTLAGRGDIRLHCTACDLVLVQPIREAVAGRCPKCRAQWVTE